jgi:RimJ/RimL family protein N-acetyltransferase
VKLVFGPKDALAAFYTAHTDVDLGVSNFTTYLGVATDAGSLVAVVGYTDFQEQYGDIRMHIAASDARWATRTIIGQLLRYPFGQLQCQRVTAIIPARNARAQRLLRGLGFLEEGRVRRAFGDDDALVHGLLFEEARRWTARDEMPAASQAEGVRHG